MLRHLKFLGHAIKAAEIVAGICTAHDRVMILRGPRTCCCVTEFDPNGSIGSLGSSNRIITPRI